LTVYQPYDPICWVRGCFAHNIWGNAVVSSAIMSKQAIDERGERKAAAVAPRPRLQLVSKVTIDRARDALLTDFGKTTLEDR
jgi:hypothetical protein